MFHKRCLATLTSLAEAAGLFAGGGHEDTVRRRHTAETSLSPEAARVVLVTTGRRHCNKGTFPSIEVSRFLLSVLPLGAKKHYYIRTIQSLQTSV